MPRLARHILGLLLVTVSACSAIAAEPITPVLLTTFTNPTPAVADNFGRSVAALGTDRVLIGASRDDVEASDAGAAYLFSTKSTLLMIFTNPTPADGDYFGHSVAVLGTGQLLIGALQDDTSASNSGAAYLFNTNGSLLTTFNNPSPTANDQFGLSVAAFGTDRVLITAYLGDVGATDTGAAYLFSTNGTVLTTFTNPTPEPLEGFGYSVAAVSTDRVLIGAFRANTGVNEAGAAYLFSTNGALLTTFLNPSPSTGDRFGVHVTPVGTDRVVIGADADDKGATDAGVAYLFKTNGALLVTFTNPTPAVGDLFGRSVTVVGTDGVLIGASSDNTGASDTGAAYLFSTNGTLLTTFTNPTPSVSNRFGWSVVAVGSDRLLIGAYGADAGMTNAGAAYLFLLASEFPSLYIARGNSQCSVSWLTDEPGLILQQSDAPALTAMWTDTSESVVTNGLTNLVLQTVPAGVTNRFYRLRRP